MATNENDQGPTYLSLRREVDATWLASRQHLAAYQALLSLHNAHATDGMVMIFGPDYKPDQSENIPIDVGRLSDMPSAMAKEFLLSRIEYHKMSLQDADRRLAKLVPQMISLSEPKRAAAPAPAPAPVNKPAPLPESPTLDELSARAAAFVNSD